jgi:hypothetical protein
MLEVYDESDDHEQRWASLYGMLAANHIQRRGYSSAPVDLVLHIHLPRRLDIAGDSVATSIVGLTDGDLQQMAKTHGADDPMAGLRATCLASTALPSVTEFRATLLDAHGNALLHLHAIDGDPQRPTADFRVQRLHGGAIAGLLIAAVASFVLLSRLDTLYPPDPHPGSEEGEMTDLEIWELAGAATIVLAAAATAVTAPVIALTASITRPTAQTTICQPHLRSRPPTSPATLRRIGQHWAGSIIDVIEHAQATP